jgi:hypothetical protein
MVMLKNPIGANVSGRPSDKNIDLRQRETSEISWRVERT